MRRTVLLLAVVLVAAACGDSGGTVVASVNGTEIHQADVLALRTTPEDLVALDSEDFRQELMFLVAQATVQTSLEKEFGVRIDDAEFDDAVDLALRQSGLTIEEAAGNLADPAATPERYRRVVQSEVLRNRASLAITSSAAFLDDLMANDIDIVSTVCVGHVLVADEAAAIRVLGRLEGGAPLADIANELSLDTGTPNGNLGCSPPARFVEPFAVATLAAPVGEPFGPVRTDFGWHIIVVDDRLVPTRAQLEADPQAYLPPDLAGAEFTRWFNAMLRAADVSVLAEIGTWYADGPGILPPTDG